MECTLSSLMIKLLKVLLSGDKNMRRIILLIIFITTIAAVTEAKKLWLADNKLNKNVNEVALLLGIHQVTPLVFILY
jgi:hypothetical protein